MKMWQVELIECSSLARFSFDKWAQSKLEWKKLMVARYTYKAARKLNCVGVRHFILHWQYAFVFLPYLLTQHSQSAEIKLVNWIGEFDDSGYRSSASSSTTHRYTHTQLIRLRNVHPCFSLSIGFLLSISVGAKHCGRLQMTALHTYSYHKIPIRSPHAHIYRTQVSFYHNFEHHKSHKLYLL